ncbi:hypothetical protein BATDEDRAFT_88499 [Batrachochytrium dendrobatidis JAM81]|uniref:MI domain-containing protein n=1 Tax=Batrachochytrium dendrobatidis (strain JAM81 / FGSC 10211) TaxID=684364 RepID=F4P2T4_BATDJ|nr:uncharacterized protein BATDEDRAFT_88499 [Batrachochytrium dendrobatidis JAM81]EGF80076.1 hypothetical protein BATDEDRAFT_88499 [Batrachochytrium dendrobatidis JAM81]|eukprot:XP_006679158.1 hypothetical protein BATDEDRAFT_88499 [Batrachochytrium dendrobatidis JAM81]
MKPTAGGEGYSKKSTTKLPSTLEGELANLPSGSRFSFKAKKPTINRRENRKLERLAKKQKISQNAQLRKNPSKLRTPNKPSFTSPESEAMKAAASKRVDAILKQREKKKEAAEAVAKLQSNKDREEQQLRKLAEKNPAFFKLLQDQNLVSKRISVGHNAASTSIELDAEESNIKTYSKLLKLKDGSINQSFKRDGLDFLLDGISTKTSNPKKDFIGDPDADSEDEFGFAAEAQDDVEMNVNNDSQSVESNESGTDVELEQSDSENDGSVDFDMEAISETSSFISNDLEEESGDDEKSFAAFEDNEGQSNDESTKETSAEIGKYIPPYLRKQTNSKSEQYIRVRRQIQGLLNRLTDTTLESIVLSIEEVFRNNSRHDVTEIITDIMLNYVGDQANILDSFIATYAGLIAAIFNTVGIEFGAHFIQTLTEKFDSARTKYIESSHDHADEIDKQCTNFSMLLAMLYNFGVVSCVLLYDIIRMSISCLSELDVEVLLRILRLGGQQLRSDDPTALKDIVLLVKDATSNMDQKKLSIRLKFMIETIMDLKNNKRKHMDQKVANQSQQDRIKKIVANISKRRSMHGSEPLRVGLEDIRNIATKGKWWLVGSAWVGHDFSKTNDKAVSEVKKMQPQSLELLEMARKNKMNTDVRRSIFVVLMSSEDCLDAFERLLKLNLKGKQGRDIVRVTIHCCTQEMVYNPYYALVAEQFCKHEHGFKITFQYAIWDALKAMNGKEGMYDDDDDGDAYTGEKGLIRVANLARMLAHLFANESLPLSILKAANFTTPTKLQILFFRIIIIDMILKTPVLKSSNPDSKFQRPFTRVKSQPELSALCEGLFLTVQAHILLPLNSGQISALGIKEKDAGLVRQRAKLIKEIFS